MFDAQSVVEKAKGSGFYLWLLNQALDRMVPFNRPHRLRVLAISDEHIRVRIPYVRKNLNHIRGLHACALATVSEFATGFFLISKLDGTKFRLIMQRLEMEYHYQGKMDAAAEFRASESWFREKVYEPLQHQDAIVVVCEVGIHDVKGNHLTTGRVHWQIKKWEKVRTTDRTAVGRWWSIL